jgi:hypothetical protein
MRISIGSEVLGEERAAFTVVRHVRRRAPDRRDVFVEHRDRRITRQVDVEAWD